MISKMALFSVCLLGSFSVCESTINYETYLESWDSGWNSALTGLPPAPGGTSGTSYAGVSLNVSFGAYIFDNPYTTLSGLQFSDSDLITAIAYVQSHGGKAKVSFGGASYASPYYPNYFISESTQDGGWPANMTALANGVIATVEHYGLDGVDFDIEDSPSGFPPGVTSENFPTQLIEFLQLVRAGLPNTNITITIPAQGWGTYWETLAKNAAAIDGLVDAISFMEYDIWVNPDLPQGYPQQIEADIVTYNANPSTAPAPNYSAGWGIPYSLIQVGLMFANDDNGQFLSVDAATSLTDIAVNKGLYGVLGWDLDRDAGTDPNPAPVGDPPYAYSEAIRNAIDSPKLFGTFQFHGANKKLFRTPRIVLAQKPFTQQSPPPHGAP